MKIKTALTLKNTGVIAVVFLLCMTLIYLVSEHIRSNTFFHNLKSEAVTNPAKPGRCRHHAIHLPE